MNIHIALYRWKQGTAPEEIQRFLKEVEALADKVPGVLSIQTGENTSKYGEGYTHAILVRAEDEAAIEAYRQHPDHKAVAQAIEAIEENGIGVDFRDA
jgi:heme-degrading monooxygenase HmoA